MSFAFRPVARIEIDGQGLSAAEAGLESVRLTLGIATHGQVALAFWQASRFASAAPGASLTVALGEDDTPVLSGAVTVVAKAPERLLIEGADAAAVLSHTRMSTTFRDMNAGDIVSAVAGEAGVTIDTVDDGPKFPAYAIDNRASLWRHLIELAALTGADLTTTAEGGLRFAAGSGAQVRQLRKGADLLDWRTEDAPAPTSPAYGAYGAASAGGAQRWHHIAPDPLGATPPPAHVPGAARSREIADAATDAAALRAARAARRAHALILGNAEIRPADTVEILEQDTGGLLGQAAGALGLGGGGGPRYRVLGVSHRLDAGAGFTTALALEGDADEASSGSVLGAVAGGLG